MDLPVRETDFRLLETMKVSADGAIQLLPHHLARLSGSASHFGFACDLARIEQAVAGAARKQPAPVMARLELARDGTHDLQFKPLPPAGAIRCLRLSRIRVNSSDPMLYHKTTARGIYAQARTGCAEEEDVILANERGEITETTITNIAVFRNKLWVTPVISCGLLPGAMRAHLLAEGDLVEGIVRLEELSPGESIRCFNAVRGVFDVPFSVQE